MGQKSETGLSFPFRTLRVYSTQKKRVAFNVSKMLTGAGAEGEVGRRCPGFAWQRDAVERRQV